METNIYTLDLEKLDKVEIGQNKKKIEFCPLKFTNKNRKLILACIGIDSSYRISFDETNDKSSAWYIKNKLSKNYEEFKSPRYNKKEIIQEICRRIDKENATHLSVSSMGGEGEDKTHNQGISTMAGKIVENYPDILKYLEDDKDGKIVDEISKYIEDKNNGHKVLNKLSFASKFCTYVSRHSFDRDDMKNKYSIYDSVLCSILPFYMLKYREYLKSHGFKITRSNFTKSGQECIASKTKEGYGWYCKLIGLIIDAINEDETNDINNLNRKDFDLMLWYYYKGDSDLIAASYAYVNKIIKSQKIKF